MAKRKKAPIDWTRVMQIRCKSKRGEAMTDEERDIIDLALNDDPGRYSEMTKEVIARTLPFGASTPRGEEG